MPSHPWLSPPAALDCAVGAGTIGGNTLTGAVPSDLNSVHTDSVPVPTDRAPVHSDLVAVHSDSAPVHTDFAPASLVTLFGTTPPCSCYLQTVVFSKRSSK
jgi:hypothetical protein